MTLRTWHAEMLTAAVVLAGSAVLSGGRTVDFLVAFAVLFSFGHASVGERLREREAARANPEVDCYLWLDRYFALKELAWVTYFIAARAWPALVGCALFLAYPFWRRFWRAHYPQRENSP